ncbi:hypothetical protein INT47_005566 [Mucor saturninus]|uniref:Uncharacterized protein n=1 Tax=Mucor saturninus TaxID=64648 RepID=A0A8H7VCE2_9FUNG|nr:hypothetical protein INT47_005566 [Mucor saturninus]
MFSHVSKLCFDMLSPKLNTRFKFDVNEDTYRFALETADFTRIKTAMDDSLRAIPADFSGSFAGVNLDNVRSIYRSVDWIAWLVHVIPTIVAPLFHTREATTGFIALSRNIQLSFQWSISESEVKEIERCFKTWFDYLNTCFDSSSISRTVFRSNMHQLNHIPYMIRRMGPLRCYSARLLESSIGIYKKRIRLSLNPGVNAGNVMETREMFSFLQSGGIIDSSAYDLKDKSPFHWRVNTVKLGQVVKQTKENHNYTIGGYLEKDWFKALSQFLIRLTGNTSTVITSFQQHQFVNISQKLWANNQIYISDLCKSKNAASSRGGEYIMFTAIHKNRMFRPVENWYVCKVLFFFDFTYQEDAPGSNFVFGELMKNHDVSPYSKAIPRVKRYDEAEQKQIVIFDAEDLLSAVGLVNAVDGSNNKYVIKTGGAFKVDMSSTAGSVGNIVFR